MENNSALSWLFGHSFVKLIKIWPIHNYFILNLYMENLMWCFEHVFLCAMLLSKLEFTSLKLFLKDWFMYAIFSKYFNL